MYIGGDSEGSIPLSGYLYLLRNFPNTTELNHYAASRVNAVLRDYLDTSFDAMEVYNTYLNNSIEARESKLFPSFTRIELAKYRTLLKRLEEMLANEIEYSEKQWQREIVSIVRLLYPKYIRVFENVPIRDTINSTSRRLDLMLIDARGHVDILEIKKPFDRCILSRSEYRGNYVPAKELSGAVMQIEKYIYYLSKWGTPGERALTKRYRGHLPAEVSIKIVNPKGIIIMGRENEMSERQRGDFEVVKRKYINIVDIISYDDLLLRLRVLIDSLLGNENHPS